MAGKPNPFAKKGAQGKVAADTAYDRKNKIKEDSPRDQKIDARRGVTPAMEKAAKGGKRK